MSDVVSRADVPRGRRIDVWNIAATIGTVIGTALVIAGLLYAWGWSGAASANQIAALNTLIATTVDANRTANSITNANVTTVNGRVDALRDEIKERRTEVAAEADKAAAEMDKRRAATDMRFSNDERRVDLLDGKLNEIKLGVAQLSAMFCFWSKQQAGPHSSVDCTRGLP